jgi:hypothetical protein
VAREDARAKGMRYITSGRLIVTLVAGIEIRALCRGDSGEVFELGFRRGGWWCSCPASDFALACAHLVALRTVTLNPRGQWREIGSAPREAMMA